MMNIIQRITETIKVELLGKCDEEVVNNLINKIEKQSKLRNIDVSEILYAKYYKTTNKIVCRTKDREHEFEGDNTDIEYLLNNGFVIVERNTFVNLNHVRNYNSYYVTLYFKSNKEDEIKLVITSHAMNKRVIKELGKELDLYNNDLLDYSQAHKKRKLHTLS